MPRSAEGMQWERESYHQEKTKLAALNTEDGKIPTDSDIFGLHVALATKHAVI